MFLEIIPLLFGIIAFTYGEAEVSVRFNRTDGVVAFLKPCLEEPEYRDYAKTARYIVHQSGKLKIFLDLI